MRKKFSPDWSHGLNMHPSDWFFFFFLNQSSVNPQYCGLISWGLLGACRCMCRFLRVCWFICVLLDHMPCLPLPSRHVGITPASRQQKPPSSLPLLTLDVTHHRVLTGDNADNPWEIKTVRGGQRDLDQGFFLFCFYTRLRFLIPSTHMSDISLRRKT